MGCAIFGFPEAMGQARRLARELGIAVHPVALHRFPDGESLVGIAAPSPETALLLRSLDDPNGKLVEVLLAASALRDNGAARVMLVAPYLAYMRQDIAFHPGEAVSQKVIGSLLADHFDGVMAVDPHLHRTPALAQVMPGIEAVAISAAPLLGQAVRDLAEPLLAGPDGESRQWVEAVAAPLGLDVLIGSKTRHGDRGVAVTFAGAQRARGRQVVLVDDVVSSGETLIAAARVLRAAGAARIEALVTHCLAGAGGLATLRRAGIGRVRATDSVAGPAAEIPLAGLLAGAIRECGWTQG